MGRACEDWSESSDWLLSDCCTCKQWLSYIEAAPFEPLRL